ncbi:MAG: replication restart helicase PriA [Flavobacterium sp.]
MELFFIDIILPLPLDTYFTYSINKSEFSFLKIGMRVVVPFGKSKICTALIAKVHQNPPILYEAKEIYQIIDETPIVLPSQLELWEWISKYYMASIGNVLKAALPSSFILESESIVQLNQTDGLEVNALLDDEYLIYEALQKQSTIKLAEISEILNKKKVISIVQNMIDRGILRLHEEVIQKYKPKKVKYVRLHEDFETNEGLQQLLLSLKKAPNQERAILTFFKLKTEKMPIAATILAEISENKISTIKALEDKNILVPYFLVHDRTDFDALEPLKKVLLSAQQQKAYEKIQLQFKEKNICLLHGVTSSGKTSIYIQMLQDMLNEGKQSLFLLPEIALTTQIVSRLRSFFGNKVAVFHSKITQNERQEVWHQTLQSSEKAQIIIGARSALFLPFSNLGLIVIDEEHEQNFKQSDPSPRYHARDTALVMAQKMNAKVLLGSATPSVETYFNVENGKYGKVDLFERFGDVKMPDIELIDLKEKYLKKQMVGHFSTDLILEIQDALSNREQVILFQNRRGFAPLMECLTCGHVPQCPNCAVSLTFHKYKNQLRCHYCGHSVIKPTHCHQCFSVELTTKGFGTEQIELELASLFPTAKIQRMDHDTTKGKYGFEKIIDTFQNREVDILVGTQMIAKGLDFENVSLVGVLNADNMLYHPDFRAFERTFQLLTQVSGRAGRTSKQGKVMIQTYSPDHYILKQVLNQDYNAMFNSQLNDRFQYHYPPYYRLIKVTLKHKNHELLTQSADWMYGVLKQNSNIPILGPEEPAINRIKTLYIREILIKIPADQNVARIKKILSRVLHSFDAIAQFKSVRKSINVDFY